MPTTRIFVSYSRQDQKVLTGEVLGGEEISLLSFLELLEDVEEPAIELFVDKEIRVGERWEDRLEAELQQADIVLALVSRNSLGSEWCRKEIEIALERGAFIFPLILNECPWQNIRWVKVIQVLPPNGDTLAGQYRDATQRGKLYNELFDSLLRRAETLEEAGQRRAERRPLTEMRCIPPGLEGESEPDRLSIESIRASVEQAVSGLGGVSENESDGTQTARFGYPQAQERAAQRAVLAALEITAATDAPGIGIHSAQVVVREDEDEKRTFFYGQTTKVATQLAERAQPGQVLISDSTRARVDRFIRCEVTDATVGTNEEPVYRAIEEFDGAVDSGELVGRDRHLEQLREHWQAPTRGRGRVVLLVAPMGMGKSRLLAEFKRQVLGPRGLRRLVQWRASPFHRSQPLYPALEGLRSLLRLDRDDANVDESRLVEAIRGMGLSVPETTPLIADLLQIELSADFPAVESDPRRKMRKTQAAILDSILRMSEAGDGGGPGADPEPPLTWLVEDLHWADPDTLDLLDMAVRSVRDLPILMVCSFRPDEFSPREWPDSHRLELGKLDDDQVRQIFSGVLGDRLPPPEALNDLVSMAQGIPLWAEEVARAQLETASSKKLPSSLQEWLWMRLDRLGPAKEVAQCAAVLGLSCSQELLLPVSGLDLEDLEKCLDELVTHQILRETRDWRRGEFRYEFHHASYQEAAYRSLVDEDLRRLHLSAASALITEAKDVREPDQVARHLQAGGDYQRAVEYWRQAGERAFERSYVRQARNYLERAQRVLETELRDDPARTRLELGVQETLGPALATSEFASSDVRQAYRRALELRQSSGLEGPFWVLWGYWRIHFAIADLQRALSYARSLVHLAEPAEGLPMGHPMTRIAARFTAGATLFCLGRFQEALAELETGVGYDTPARRRQWYEETGRHHYAEKTGEDAGVANLLWAGWAKWFLGFPEAAQDYCDRAVALAEKLRHRYSEAYAKVFASALAYHMGSPDRVRELAEDAVRISKKYGSWWGAPGEVLLGWCSKSPSRTRRAVDRYFATGARVHLGQFLSILSEVEDEAGWHGTAVRRLGASLSAVADTGERYFKAENLSPPSSVRAGGRQSRRGIPGLDPSARDCPPPGGASPRSARVDRPRRAGRELRRDRSRVSAGARATTQLVHGRPRLPGPASCGPSPGSSYRY